LEVLPKPEDAESWRELVGELPATLRAAVGVRSGVRGRRSGPPPGGRGAPPEGRVAPLQGRIARAKGLSPRGGGGLAPLRFVAVGASTGGPAALRELLEALPADAPVGFAVVQHISHGFEAGLADWLDKALPFDVRLARDGETLAPGSVRIA